MLLLSCVAVGNECMVSFHSVSGSTPGCCLSVSSAVHVDCCIHIYHSAASSQHTPHSTHAEENSANLVYDLCTVLERIFSMFPTAILQTCLLGLLADGLLQRYIAAVSTSSLAGLHVM